MDFRLDKLYLDELVEGISSGVTLDALHHLDEECGVDCICDIDLGIIFEDRYILEIDIDFVTETLQDYASYVDLTKLIPEKFTSSIALQQLLYVFGLQTGIWLGQINDIAKLIDKYSVGDDYIQYLADLIGLTIVFDENTSLEEKRRQLDTAIPWLKMKGTYQALSYIAYVLGIYLNVYDLYTNNYSTFTREPWFSGGINENPGGLNSSYYKSPHIDLEIFLGTVISDDYLFSANIFLLLQEYIEKIRPVNVVPHYSMYLNPITDKSGFVVNTRSILCKTFGDWDAGMLNLDSNPVLNLDNGNVLDYTDDAVFNQVVKWKLGTGNRGVSPDHSNFAIETPVLSGTVDAITILSNKVEYEFTVPISTVQFGLSELGLFLNDETTLKIGATFPMIDKINGLSLKVKVTVNIS